MAKRHPLEVFHTPLGFTGDVFGIPSVEHRGGALGAETDHSTGYAPLFGDIDQTFTRALVEADIGYIMHIDRMTAQALLIASDANGSWLGGNGNTTSLRLALRIGL